jgi:antitoxin (DNA-binding transcriptional repressor) of toxin-antitoxin stability system
MQTVTIEEAQARLPELIAALPSEGSIVITRGAQTVAKMTAPETEKPARQRSMLDVPPVSLGEPLRPYPDPADDILGEMLEEKLGTWRTDP